MVTGRGRSADVELMREKMAAHDSHAKMALLCVTKHSHKLPNSIGRNGYVSAVFRCATLIRSKSSYVWLYCPKEYGDAPNAIVINESGKAR
jgi:hypothetical protein